VQRSYMLLCCRCWTAGITRERLTALGMILIFYGDAIPPALAALAALARTRAEIGFGTDQTERR
jgi:hypothetical protein